ncbi:hypothetical protein L7F22_039099 [Adiantum nelumboides]|nr:hypothetical protein [Adiantum nelumboides]
MDVGEIDRTNEQNLPDETQDAERDAAQITNSLLPPPPSTFSRFSRENIARYNVMKEAKENDLKNSEFDWENSEPAERIARQKVILETVSAAKEREMKEKTESVEEEKELAIGSSLLPVPNWDILLAMEPPNVDWIKEDGYYSCFGDRWPVEESLPSLQEMGMAQIYPTSENEEMDRPAILTSLLRTLLKSYLRLIDTVLSPPQAYLSTQNDPNTGQITNQEWLFTTQDKARQINDISINFMHLLNETRPLQAREQLRDLMRDQLNNRKQEANLMRLQCQAIRAEIQSIKNGMRNEV